MKKFFVGAYRIRPKAYQIRFIAIFAALVVVAAFTTGCRDDFKPQKQLEVSLRADITASMLKVANDEWQPNDRIGFYMKPAGHPLSTALVSNVEKRLQGDLLVSTQPVLYPETGSVDFIAYYPHQTVGSNFTIVTPNLANQTAAVAQEMLYSNNVTNQLPTDAIVALNFNYVLAKATITVQCTDLSANDYATMSASIEGVYTQANMSLADGSFQYLSGKGSVAFNVRERKNNSVVFEALGLPMGVGDIKIVFNYDGKMYQWEANTDIEGGLHYIVNFESFTTDPIVERKQIKASSYIIPRDVNERNIGGSRSGETGTLTWTLSANGTLTISGTGEMPDYDGLTQHPWAIQPWVDYRDDIRTIVIEQGVTTIGARAFRLCTELTSIEIPNSVTSIGMLAFQECRSLTSITIPNSVTTIGLQAFRLCTALTSIVLPNSVTIIENFTFNECFGLTSVVIPDNVITIGTGAFQDCYDLSSVTIGNSVTNIGVQAFLRCTGLSSIVIPNSVETIENFAFFGCNKLTSVTFGNWVATIGNRAFEQTALTSVVFPNSVKNIGVQAFAFCYDLESITFGNSVELIDNYAFGITSITSVTIPQSVTTLGNSPFGSCQNLTTISVESGNTSFSVDDNVLFNIDKTVLVQYPAGKTATSYTIPQSVTSIANTVFFGSNNLTSITIPASVVTIGQWVFDSCVNLTEIINNATVPQAITADVFLNLNPSDITLRVPAASLAAYQADEVWSRLNIVPQTTDYVPDVLEGKLLILQAYGANSTAAGASHPFVELYNTTNAPINLSGISLYYADGIRGFGVTGDTQWRTITLTGTIPALGSYLIMGPYTSATGSLQLANNYGDINDTNFELSNRAFKVAIIRGSFASNVQNPFNMDGSGRKVNGYIDMVGAANDLANATNPDNIFGYETAPARCSASEAVRRSSLVDTNNNSVDFIAARFGNMSEEELEARRPRNSSFGTWNPFTLW